MLGSTIAALAHIRAAKAPFGNASGGPRRRRKVARCEGLSSLVNVKLSILSLVVAEKDSVVRSQLGKCVFFEPHGLPARGCDVWPDGRV